MTSDGERRFDPDPSLRSLIHVKPKTKPEKPLARRDSREAAVTSLSPRPQSPISHLDK